jgi:hypothetical protein
VLLRYACLGTTEALATARLAAEPLEEYMRLREETQRFK